VHLKPFRKLGPFFGRIAAFFLLPTWVGTVLLAPVPFLGVAAYLESLSKTSTEKVFLGMCLHGAAFLLCLIVLWRLFFARKRDASGAIRERDPRFAFQWILGLSLFFSLGLKGQGGESFLRPVGIYLPVLFLWAYSSKDSSGVASADIHSYFLNTSLAFGFYFLLALVLGVVWLTRKSVWKNFWAESASSRIPGDGTEVAESEPNRSESKP
jgi:hypothetical protein